MTGHRQPAIDAAAQALHEARHHAGCEAADCDGSPAGADIGDAKTALEAALPHMLRIHADHDRKVRAAQREADAQLADKMHAYYPLTVTGDPVKAFSDLLRNPLERITDDTPSA
jgi:hypothetical protein